MNDKRNNCIKFKKKLDNMCFTNYFSRFLVLTISLVMKSVDFATVRLIRPFSTFNRLLFIC